MNQPTRKPVLSRVDEHRYHLCVYGPLHGSAVDALELVSLPVGCRTLLIDLRAATLCTTPARRRLVALQRVWTQAGIRTAWLADRSTLRGAALWILHQAHDERGRAVGSLVQANRWLDGRMSRTAMSLSTLGVVPR